MPRILTVLPFGILGGVAIGSATGDRGMLEMRRIVGLLGCGAALVGLLAADALHVSDGLRALLPVVVLGVGFGTYASHRALRLADAAERRAHPDRFTGRERTWDSKSIALLAGSIAWIASGLVIAWKGTLVLGPWITLAGIVGAFLAPTVGRGASRSRRFGGPPTGPQLWWLIPAATPLLVAWAVQLALAPW